MPEPAQRIAHLHPYLSWGAKGLLDYIYDHRPSPLEVHAASSDTVYATTLLLRRLRRLGLINHTQERDEVTGLMGETRYFVTDLALTAAVPAGTKEGK